MLFDFMVHANCKGGIRIFKMERDFKVAARELMVGAYDLHVHTSPSAFPRIQDGFQLLRDADQAGMAGVMLKSHYEPTALRARLINQYSHCRAKAYGGLTLNWPVGGLNVYAVENALKVGSKIIWMPTRDADNSLRFGNMDGDFFRRPGISIWKEDGESLKDSVYDIMDTVKKYDAFLATGHLSPEESIRLCTEGRRRGVRMILTHPEFHRTFIPAETQREMADLGVLIEKNWFNIAQKCVSAQQMAAAIRMVGSERAYIATDRGQAGQPTPVSEYERFVETLLKEGLTERELRNLTHDVPARIIGE